MLSGRSQLNRALPGVIETDGEVPTEPRLLWEVPTKRSINFGVAEMCCGNWFHFGSPFSMTRERGREKEIATDRRKRARQIRERDKKDRDREAKIQRGKKTKRRKDRETQDAERHIETQIENNTKASN